MTKQLLTLFATLAFSLQLFAQAPPAFKYQGVARNTEGETLKNQVIQLRFILLEENENNTSTEVYEEEHSISTSPQGVFSVNIGEGNPIRGNFAVANWPNKPHSLQIKIDPSGAGNFLDLGSSRLLSVPYALHAETTSNTDDADADPDNELQQLTLNGLDLSLSKGGGTIPLSQLGNSPWVGSPNGQGIYYEQHVGIQNNQPKEELAIGSNFSGSDWTIPAITIGGDSASGAAFELGNSQKTLRMYSTPTEDAHIETVENNEPGQGVLNISARQVNIGPTAFSKTDNYPLSIQANVNEAHCLLLESTFNDHLWEIYPNSATNQLFLIYNGNPIGYWNPNTGIYTAGISDQRRKEKITSLNDLAARFESISIYEYHYQGNPREKYTGFLAQELKEVFPTAVSEAKLDGQEEGVLMVDYDQVTAINSGAIQEQQAYIIKLEQQVKNLEAQLSEQEKRLTKIETLINKK